MVGYEAVKCVHNVSGYGIVNVITPKLKYFHVIITILQIITLMIRNVIQKVCLSIYAFRNGCRFLQRVKNINIICPCRGMILILNVDFPGSIAI